MNIQVTDSLASLRAQLVQAQEKLAIAQKAVKAAERAEERASNLVEDIREAIAMSQLQSWGEHPDLAELMNSGEGSTMVFYRALGEVAGRWGFGLGGTWTDTNQTVLRFGLNRGERGAVDRVAAAVLYFSPAMKPIKGGSREGWVRFAVSHQEPELRSWELRYAKKTGKARLVSQSYGTEEDRHDFDTLLAALHYIEKHLWCDNVIDEDTTTLLEDGTVVL